MERVMPIPYNLSLDLYAYTSNTDQSFQITEQILMLFDPMLQIQKSDEQADWSKITQVELTGIGNEESIPIGTEKRVIVWNYQFTVPIWITPPAAVKNSFVSKIKHRMTTDELSSLTEITEDGDILNFET